MQVALVEGDNDIDTGLTQVNRGMAPDPTLAERTMVIIVPPTDNWNGITMLSDPTFDPVTQTVHVVLTANNDFTVNVLFWVPHTLVGPVSVDTYVISEG